MMIRIIAAINMTMVAVVPAWPKTAWATGMRGEMGSARTPSTPSTPMTAASTSTNEKKQMTPQVYSAFGTSLPGFLYSGA